MRVKWLKCFAKEHGNLHNLKLQPTFRGFIFKGGGGGRNQKNFKTKHNHFSLFSIIVWNTRHRQRYGSSQAQVLYYICTADTGLVNLCQ